MSIESSEILLVIPDAALRTVLVDVLASDGYDAVAVGNEADASDHLAHVQPALLVLDGSPSFHRVRPLLERLAHAKDAPPTLLLSDVHDLSAVAEAYGVAHLRKPFGHYALLRGIEHARVERRRPSVRLRTS